jgi:RHS repeat-associated protein
MLNKVITPNNTAVNFTYDPLGRRIAKVVKEKVCRYIWDGNVLLHEWKYEGGYPPLKIIDEEGIKETKEPIENVVTWLYEEGSFIPCTKIEEEKRYSIVADYLGTPTHAYNETGSLVWERELDCYGAVRKEKGEKGLVPQLYQGQYVDSETGLAYNRFRYYDVDSGGYISQDPIGLEGGILNIYNYVKDTNSWTDIFGLLGEGDTAPYGSSSHKGDGREAHELLRNKYLQDKGLTGNSRHRQNPSIALSPTNHDIVHAEEYRLRNAMGLGNNQMLKSGRLEIRLSAQAINNTLVANGTISIDQLRIARKLAERFAKKTGCH